MELNKGHMIFGAACLVAGGIIGAGLRGCTIKPVVPAEPIVIHDTTIIKDTAYIAARTKTIAVHDTVWPAKDSTKEEASEPQMLVYETKEYRDTFATDSSRIELGVRFSGWHAQIDGIDLKSQYTIHPRTIEKKKGWGQFVGIGIGVGYGASFVGNGSGATIVHAAPEIGVHITYGWGYHW